MKRYVFIVQGEGRGHLSQALAMKQIIDQTGGEILAVFAGSFKKPLPDYFSLAFGHKLRNYKAPGFCPNRKKTGIRLFRTFLINLFHANVYFREIRKLRGEITALSPDTVINFYEINGALAMKKLSPGIKKISVAHHFFYSHPDAVLAKGFPFQKFLLLWHNRILLKVSDRALALSFRPAAEHGKIVPVPPLLRDEVKNMERIPGTRDLAYFLYSGFIDELAALSAKYNAYQADVFVPELTGNQFSGLEIHLPDSGLFLRKLAACRSLICTAGFETVAEAAYLGIPVMVIPTRRHFEQYCNALDMQRALIGLSSTSPDPGLLFDLKPADPSDFRRWAGEAGKRIAAQL